MNYFDSKLEKAFEELGNIIPRAVSYASPEIFSKAFERADKAINGAEKAWFTGINSISNSYQRADSEFDVFAAVILKDIFASAKDKKIIDKDSLCNYLDLEYEEYEFIDSIIQGFDENYNHMLNNYLQHKILYNLPDEFLFEISEKLYETGRYDILYSNKEELADDLDYYIISPELSGKETALYSYKYQALCKYAFENEPDVFKAVCAEVVAEQKSDNCPTAEALYAKIEKKYKELNLESKETER